MLKVALVRGRHLNKYEMQSYEPLADKYQVTGFGSLTAYHDNFSFPVIKLLSPIDILSLTNRLKISQRLTLGLLNRLFIDSQYLLGLEGQLKGYDIAHTADTYYHFTHQCIIAKRKGCVKKVVATAWENIPFNNEGIWGRKEFKKEAIGAIDHFIAVTKQAKEVLILEGCPSEKISIVPLGIDTRRFKPVDIRKNNKYLTILFVGRLEQTKGIFDLVSAASNLIEDNDLKKYTLRFILVGDGSEKSKIIKLESYLGISSFFTHQTLTYDKMPSVYRKADIFIAPSRSTSHWQEQFSVALLEAQSSGLPIISTQTGAISENVDGVAILTKPGDVEELTRALKKLITNPDIRYKMGKKARERAVKLFDIEIISKEIGQIYQSLF